MDQPTTIVWNVYPMHIKIQLDSVYVTLTGLAMAVISTMVSATKNVTLISDVGDQHAMTALDTYQTSELVRDVTANVSQTIQASSVQCILVDVMSYALVDVSDQLHLTATSVHLTPTGTKMDAVYVTKTSQETSAKCTLATVTTPVVYVMDLWIRSVTSVLRTLVGIQAESAYVTRITIHKDVMSMLETAA
jgi:hypothetical protein